MVAFFNSLFGWYKLASACLPLCSVVADVTFEVIFCTSARLTFDYRLVIFAIKALGILLSADVGYCLTKEAFGVSVAAIIWGPVLIV